MEGSRISRLALGTVTCAIVAALLSACAGSSPRPDTKASPPPVPAGSRPLGRVTWSTVDVPAGLGDSANVSDAAAGPGGFVLVGDGGPFGFSGFVLVSTDGRAWLILR